MLVLTREINKVIRIGDDIKITLCEINRDKVKIGITAPRYLPVHREEVYDLIQAGKSSKRQCSHSRAVQHQDGKLICKLCGCVGQRAGRGRMLWSQATSTRTTLVDEPWMDVRIVPFAVNFYRKVGTMAGAMKKQLLKLDAIGDIDHGSLRVAVNQALKLVTQDLADRPALAQKRKVTLQLEFKPVVDKNSNQPQLDGAEFAWQIKTNVPAIGSSATKMSVQNTGELAFHSDLPDAPDDNTLMEESERRQEELRRRERENNK